MDKLRTLTFIKISDIRLRLDSIVAYGLLYYAYDEADDDWIECDAEDAESCSLFVDTRQGKQYEFFEEDINIRATLTELDELYLK